MAGLIDVVEGGEQQTAEERVYAGKYKTVEELETAYQGAQSLLGKRLNELDDESRKLFTAHVDKELEATLERNLRERLATDEEWLNPLLEARKPKAPEQYEINKELLGFEPPAEDPLINGVIEFAKRNALQQDAINELFGVYGKVIKDQEAAAAAELEAESAKITDYPKRQRALKDFVVGLTGSTALLEVVSNAKAFADLERLVAASREAPLPATKVETPPPRKTKAEIMELRFSPDFARNPSKQEEYNKWFKEEYPGDYTPGL